MGSVFAVLLATLGCIWVFKKYHLWKSGHPILHIFMMGCTGLFATIAGNTVFKNGIPGLPFVSQWAYIDAFKDDVMGPHQLMFWGALIALGMVGLVVYNFVRGVVLRRVNNSVVHTTWFGIYIGFVVVLFMAFGMNLHGMRISLPNALSEPTSKVAYTAVNGGLDAGGNLITQFKTAVREQKHIVPNSVMAEYEATKGGQLEETSDDEQVISKSQDSNSPQSQIREKNDQSSSEDYNPADHEPAVEPGQPAWQPQDNTANSSTEDLNSPGPKKWRIEKKNGRLLRFPVPDQKKNQRGPDND